MSAQHRDPAAPSDEYRAPSDGYHGDLTRHPVPPAGQLSWESTVTAPTEWVPYVYTEAEVAKLAGRRGLSTASVVCGVLGLVVAIFGVWGVFLSLASVILALGARVTEARARMLWLSGLLTGLAGLAIEVGWFVYITQVLLAP